MSEPIGPFGDIDYNKPCLFAVIVPIKIGDAVFFVTGPRRSRIAAGAERRVVPSVNQMEPAVDDRLQAHPTPRRQLSSLKPLLSYPRRDTKANA
jgi:hypothetical protein